MAGWHRWLDGREYGWIPGVGDGQGGLVCYDPWVAKSRTLLSDWSDLNEQSSNIFSYAYQPFILSSFMQSLFRSFAYIFIRLSFCCLPVGALYILWMWTHKSFVIYMNYKYFLSVDDFPCYFHNDIFCKAKLKFWWSSIYLVL